MQQLKWQSAHYYHAHTPAGIPVTFVVATHTKRSPLTASEREREHCLVRDKASTRLPRKGKRRRRRTTQRQRGKESEQEREKGKNEEAESNRERPLTTITSLHRQ